MKIPDFIIHYNRSEPFRTMTSLSADRRSEIIKELNETNAWGINRFLDPEYLDRRILTEQKMRAEFIKKGGNPELMHPIYFFLGRNNQFEKHDRNLGYIIDLKNINSDSISFTYGDSMLAFHEDYRNQSGEKYKNSLCGKLFRLHELEDLFSDINLPQDDPLSIEVQLWIMPSKEIVRNLAR